MKILYPYNQSWIDYPSNSDCIVVTFLGCNHNCFNCQNKELQNYNYVANNSQQQSVEIDYLDLFYSLDIESHKYRTNKICFEGGDPLYYKNIDGVRNFIHEYTSFFDVCIYTGYNIDFVKNNNLYGAKYYKCGKYEEEFKDINYGKTNNQLIFASTNQKLYDGDYNQISIDNYYTLTGETN